MVEVDDIPGIAIAEILRLNDSVSIEDIRDCISNSKTMQTLMALIKTGFPPTRHLTDKAIRIFFNIKDDLWLKEGLIMFKNRLVIPKYLRPRILRSLHSAHQGTEGMRSRASTSVYWPGINQDIRQTRFNCTACDNIAPRRAQEPLQLKPLNQYPFKDICADGFEINGVHYVAIVDRFSGLILLYHIKNSLTSQDLIRIFRSIFTSYGVSKNLYTDGGLPFQSKEIHFFCMTGR